MEEKYTIEELAKMIEDGEIEVSNPNAPETNDLTFIFQPLELSEAELTEIVSSDEYAIGSKLASKYVGMYTTMVNGGMPIETITEIIIAQHAIDSSIPLQEIINDGSVKTSKAQAKSNPVL